MPAILFIDDKPDQVDGLIKQVREKLGEDNVELRSWVPTEKDSKKALGEHLSNDTTLVVTDQDLTEAQLGLFGSTIIEWCQQRAVPVADYSRALGELKKEPDLFEIRVPRDEDKTASFVVGVFRGFDEINRRLEEDTEIAKGRSPAAILARVVDAPDAEADFALYAIRLASASGALTSHVMAFTDPEKEPSDKEKRDVLAYIVGHLLLNSVLRYPGPILSLRALKAYLAADQAGDARVLELFRTARYDGPFSELDTFHWLGKVDEILEPLIPEGALPETNGELHRQVIERALNRELERHPCPRCQGQNGGYFCPFTQKTVCIRADCSVGSNSWIPQGARICRIEREFFDEWAPVLGL